MSPGSPPPRVTLRSCGLHVSPYTGGLGSANGKSCAGTLLTNCVGDPLHCTAAGLFAHAQGPPLDWRGGGWDSNGYVGSAEDVDVRNRVLGDADVAGRRAHSEWDTGAGGGGGGGLGCKFGVGNLAI